MRKYEEALDRSSYGIQINADVYNEQDSRLRKNM